MKDQKKLSREEMRQIKGGYERLCYAECNNGGQVGPFGECSQPTENDYCVAKYGFGSYAISCSCGG